MTVIAENDCPAHISPASGSWRRLLRQVREQLDAGAAHPARSVVLLPYAQLMPLALRLWAEQFPDGFAPRFETTRNWAASAGWFTPGPNDIAFDRGRDLLTAASLLKGAGLGAQRALLADALVDQATQLAALAAAVPTELRPDWAAQARAAMPLAADGPLALEAAVARIAIAWAAASDYATDVLFEPRVARGLDALIAIQGLQPDELTASLIDHFGASAQLLAPELTAPRGHVALHAAHDGEDEAERAAACVLRHLAEGRAPVALAAGDRLLTRRISALLAARGVRIRDETGWKLSTTHAAAQLMAALRAGAAHASTDAVLDWAKLAPAFDGTAVQALEHRLRRDAVRDWASAATVLAEQPLVQQIEVLRQPLAASRRLPDWLTATGALLQGCGLWAPLADDPAGAAVITALSMSPAEQAELAGWPSAQMRMSLHEFTAWASAALEAGSFRPPHPPAAQVVVLPMSQLLGRLFAALVLPGCDEQRLPATPEPPGPWSGAQRLALRLPTRAALHAAQRGAWDVALRIPQVDVLWRTSDDNGEPLLPSPLVQMLQLSERVALEQRAPEPDSASRLRIGADPRKARAIAPQPIARPAPIGQHLPAQPLSASGYEMLRACPYRFFALRQLGLAEEGELDVDVDKRDFGNWVHLALRHFHEALQAEPGADRASLLDAAAAQATHELALDEGEFLPFGVAWPALREGYLQWLAEYEQTTGAVFEAAEQDARVDLGALQLRGRFDRVDRAPGGEPLVIDYKTESLDQTKARLKVGHEDTQLPFYALLSAADTPRAAYLNVGEREGTTLLEPPDLTQLAAQLYEGMQSDLARISAGAPLPALGEGSVCDWCAARGLCRRDFWSGP